MSITTIDELEGMKKIGHIVGYVLYEMKKYAKAGMSTADLDEFGAKLLNEFGAKSAPKETYKFPGYTCISVNNEVAHGIPSKHKILKDGDLINIDVSATLNGFCGDNGMSFVIGTDKNDHSKLVDASREILMESINSIVPGMKISDFGKGIEYRAKKRGYRVIRNLAGHGIGRSLHESPNYILNCEDKKNKQCFKENSVVAIETFISTESSYAQELKDGWTLVGDRGGYVAQHEHTIVITSGKPIILTASNNIRMA